MPNYDELVIIFEQIKPESSVSESHGIICGFICAGREMHGKAMISPFLQQLGNSSAQGQDPVLELYKESSEKIQNFEFDFQLMLPDEDAKLSQRAEALSQWCQGFLVALKMAGIEAGFTDESRQVFERFSEIATIDFEAIDFEEEDEKTYFEITEYVRFATLLFYNEIASYSTSGSEAQSDQVH